MYVQNILSVAWPHRNYICSVGETRTSRYTNMYYSGNWFYIENPSNRWPVKQHNQIECANADAEHIFWNWMRDCSYHFHRYSHAYRSASLLANDLQIYINTTIVSMIAGASRPIWPKWDAGHIICIFFLNVAMFTRFACYGYSFRPTRSDHASLRRTQKSFGLVTSSRMLQKLISGRKKKINQNQNTNNEHNMYTNITISCC